MKKVVQDYISAQNNLYSFFNVENDFYIRPLTNCKWRIKDDDDWYIVSYWGKDINITEAAVVKKNGVSQIIRNRDYTLVVAIECVKVGLVFRNENEERC